METLVRNGQTRYREQVRINGKKITSPTFARKTDARAWKSRMEFRRHEMIARGEESLAQITKVTLEDFSKTWLEDHVKNSKEFRTYIHYEQLLRANVLPILGKINLQDLREEHGIKLTNHLKATKHSPKGINNNVGLVKNILNYARRKKIILGNPWEFVPRQKSELTCDAYWSKKEIEQFLIANYHDSLYPLFYVALHSGLRMGELCGLCWDRVDFELNQITVSRIRDKLPLRDRTKTKLKRIVPMTSGVRSLLLQLMRKQLNPRFIFSEPNGTEVTYGHLYRRFHVAQKKAGFEKRIRFHDTRHTFASQFMMNGGNLFDLQKILGHTDAKMSLRYAHFSPAHLQGTIRFMDLGIASPHENESILEKAPLMPHREISGSSDNLLMLG